MAGFAGLNPNLTDLAYLTPGIDPGHQSGWDTFSPPVGRIAGVVTITECTRKAAADQLILLTGDGFTSSTYFAFYGQSTAGNGTLVKDTRQSKNLLLDATNQMASCVIPSSLPAGAVMVWAVDGGNISAPLLLNTAICWRSQDMGTGLRASAIPGNTISVYGLNLANGSTTWIYLEVLNGTAAAAFATATAANEDRVQFTLPATIGAHGSLAAGDTVRVWVHNGRGDKYGWSKVPYDITVATLTSLNLDYSAGSQQSLSSPNGTDDTSALTTAITNIRNAGTLAGRITLSAGTWHFNAVDIYSNSGNTGISIEGAGSGSNPASNTIIKPISGTLTAQSGGSWLTFWPSSRLMNCRVDTTGSTAFPGGCSHGAICCSNNQNVVLIHSNTGSDVALSLSGPTGYHGVGGVITNVTIQGPIPIEGSSFTQLVMNNLTLTCTAGVGEDDASMVCNGGGVNSLSDVSIENVTVTQNASGDADGRVFYSGATTNYLYLDSINGTMTPPASSNVGECYLLGEQQVESVWNGCSSNNSGATTAIVFPTTPNAALVVGMLVKVVSGKGVGQWGLATVISGQTVTLDKTWSVPIDSNSVLHFGSGVAYIAVRNCSITSTGIVSGAASTGWQINQQAAEFHISGHTTTNCNVGYTLLANQVVTGGGYGNYSSGQSATFSWGLVDNATVANCGWDENLGAEIGNGAVWPTHIGTIVRNTTATGTGITTRGFQAGESSVLFSSSPINLLGHDACSYSGATTGITIYPGADYRDVWWNTSMPAPGGATTGLSLSGGSTGANLIFRGTGGVTGYPSNNKAATP